LTADGDDRSAEIVITKDGKTAYVLNFAAASGAPEGSVTPINTATNTAAREIIVGMNPSAIAITAQAR
jgi:DNA-binding beta-propeller fold protein YncE